MRVKILGSGNAAKKHLEAYAKLPDLYEVADEQPDIIDICTPNYLHFEQAREALWDDKHVVCEKPIAGSLEEVDRLAGLERSCEGCVCPIFQYRFAPEPLKANHWQRDPSYYEGWRGKWGTALGGRLVSHGIHILDSGIVRHGAKVLNISARIKTKTYPIEVEDFCFVSMETKHEGSRGAIIMPLAIDQKPAEMPPDHAANSLAGYVNQFRLIHEALTTGGPLPVTLAEARKSIELLTAAYYSAYTGESVTLPLGPEHPFYGGWVKALSSSQPRRKRDETISSSNLFSWSWCSA